MNELARKIHDATGWNGERLEMATHMLAMIYSDLTGNIAIGQYFEQRMRESFFKLQGLI